MKSFGLCIGKDLQALHFIHYLSKALLMAPLMLVYAFRGNRPYIRSGAHNTVPTFKIVSSKCLHKILIGEQISMVRVKVSWPLLAREAVVHFFVFEYFQDDLVVVVLNTIDESEITDRRDMIPEAKRAVRIATFGGFAIQKVSSKRSYFSKEATEEASANNDGHTDQNDRGTSSTSSEIEEEEVSADNAAEEMKNSTSNRKRKVCISPEVEQALGTLQSVIHTVREYGCNASSSSSTDYDSEGLERSGETESTWEVSDRGGTAVRSPEETQKSSSSRCSRNKKSNSFRELNNYKVAPASSSMKNLVVIPCRLTRFPFTLRKRGNLMNVIRYGKLRRQPLKKVRRSKEMVWMLQQRKRSPKAGRNTGGYGASVPVLWGIDRLRSYYKP